MKVSRLTAVALTCVFTTVSAAINIAAPVNPVSGGRATVIWTHEASDPAEFILMLQLASDSWATGQFWEFTQTRLNRLDVTFLNEYPYVISPGKSHIYRLTARNQTNVDQVYSRSPDFNFLPAGSVPNVPAPITSSVLHVTATSTTTLNDATTTATSTATVIVTTSLTTTNISTAGLVATTSPGDQHSATTSGTGTSSAAGAVVTNTSSAVPSCTGGIGGSVVAMFVAGLMSCL